MTERERAIGARVKELRERQLKWSQADFAEQLGLTRDQLASIEYGRNPLRYVTGASVCAACNVNPRWLVSGKAPRRPNFPIPDSLEDTIPIRDLFSNAYDSVLADYVEYRLAEAARRLKVPVEQLDNIFPTDTADAVIHFLSGILSLNARIIPDDLQWEYYATLQAATDRFLKLHQKAIRAFDQQRRTGQKKKISQ